MKKLRDFLKRCQVEASFAIIVGLVSFVIGLVFTINWRTLLPEFLENLGPELVGIGITVLVIDTANQRRDKQAEIRLDKKRLVREMSSPDNATALRAVQELKDNGWLYDGSLARKRFHYMRAIVPEDINKPSGANLRRANLSSADLRSVEFFDANLQGADLSRAILQGANLEGAYLEEATLVEANLENANLNSANMENAGLIHANLRGANLWGANLQDSVSTLHYQGPGISYGTWTNPTNVQLALAGMLRLATVPNSSRYDGRYNLPGDLEWAKDQENRDITDPNKMAEYYGITVEEYLAGQEWAEEHLQKLRAIAEAWYNQHWNRDYFQR